MNSTLQRPFLKHSLLSGLNEACTVLGLFKRGNYTASLSPFIPSLALLLSLSFSQLPGDALHVYWLVQGPRSSHRRQSPVSRLPDAVWSQGEPTFPKRTMLSHHKEIIWTFVVTNQNLAGWISKLSCATFMPDMCYINKCYNIISSENCQLCRDTRLRFIHNHAILYIHTYIYCI